MSAAPRTISKPASPPQAHATKVVIPSRLPVLPPPFPSTRPQAPPASPLDLSHLLIFPPPKP
eukprot:366127-Chlamydomonas_euryale.AAC.3